jgi:AcrR family transcriptional regulator
LTDGGRELTAKQRAILEAALEVFAERGYAGAPTAEIAKRAGVAEATIFKTWKTKKDLLVAVVGPVFFHVVAPRLIGEVRALLASEWPDARSLLRALVDNRVAFFREHHRIARVVLQEAPFHPEMRRLASDVLTTHLLPVALPVIESLQRRGEITPMPPERVLRLVLTNVAGWGLVRFVLAPDAAWDDVAERDALVEFLACGLGAPSQSSSSKSLSSK